ncbi:MULTISPECIES: hypothetical protein [Actinomycetes]|uniref:hypothetical protein n=1 Tax=Actinomycetes TaxID=1760 RepID=UPI0004BE4EAB|nr:MULTISPECIES: hypothetical protein [Actinomycetes]
MTDAKKDVSGTTPGVEEAPEELSTTLDGTAAPDATELPKDGSDLPDNWDNSSGYAGASAEQLEDR